MFALRLNACKLSIHDNIAKMLRVANSPKMGGKCLTGFPSLGPFDTPRLVGYMPFAGSDERKQIQMIRTGAYQVKKDRWAKAGCGKSA